MKSFVISTLLITSSIAQAGQFSLINPYQAYFDELKTLGAPASINRSTGAEVVSGKVICTGTPAQLAGEESKTRNFYRCKIATLLDPTVTKESHLEAESLFVGLRSADPKGKGVIDPATGSETFEGVLTCSSLTGLSQGFQKVQITQTTCFVSK